MTIPAVAFEPHDLAFKRSPFDTYRWLRDHEPVHRVDARDGRGAGYWVLSRFDDVFAAARDVATFSSADGLSFEGGDKELLGLVPTIVMMDPPEHTAYRRLVSRGFTPRQVATLEPDVRAFVTARLDLLGDRLREHGRADFIEVLAKPLPSFVVATYLGVPAADRERFDDWTAAIVAANAGGDVLRDAQEAVGQLYEYFTALAARRRLDPGDDMISALVHADLGGSTLATVDLLDVLGFAFVMIAGGNDTATGLLGGAAEALTARPDQRQLLLEDPARWPSAINELLRLTSPVQGLARTTTRPVRLHGVDLPAGAKVHLLYAAANRDPRAFGPDAEELDIARANPRLLTFTSGPHHCLGAAAARLQAQVALSELVRRFPDFEVDADAGTYAPGAFVRRFATLPITATA